MGSTMSVSKKKSFPTSSGFNQAWTISLEEIVGVTSQWFPWLTIIWYVITTFHKQRKFMIIYVCFFLWARWVQRCANPWDIVVLVRIASHHQGITRYHASSFSHRAQSPNMLPPGCLFEWGNNDERSNIGFKLYTSVSPIFKQTHWSSCIILLKISIYIYPRKSPMISPTFKESLSYHLPGPAGPTCRLWYIRAMGFEAPSAASLLQVSWRAPRKLCSRSSKTATSSVMEVRYVELVEPGDGSKPWYLVNPKIAGKWMFIPLKMYL
jgi:hypothetical protein